MLCDETLIRTRFLEFIKIINFVLIWVPSEYYEICDRSASCHSWATKVCCGCLLSDIKYAQCWDKDGCRCEIESKRKCIYCWKTKLFHPFHTCIKEYISLSQCMGCSVRFKYFLHIIACNINQVHCYYDDMCIPKELHCDGKEDCSLLGAGSLDSSDEQNCDTGIFTTIYFIKQAQWICFIKIVVRCI